MSNRFSLDTTAAELESRIRAHRLLDLPVEWADELVFPHYDGLSLYNVPGTVARLLGVEALSDSALDEAVWGGESLDGEIDRVVIFLSDGLGYKWLTQLIAEDDDLAGIVGDLSGGRGPLPLTSITPSTTVAALNTLWTGRSPVAHGVVGLSMFLREFSMIGYMLSYAPVGGHHRAGDFERWGMDPKTFVPVPALADLLAERAIPTHLLLDKSLIGTGLSKILHRGVKRDHRHAHKSHSDFWLRLHDVLAETAGQRCYINVYWPAIDSLAHLYGAHTRYTRHELKDQLTHLRQVLASEAVQDGRTLFLFLADHGHHDATRKIHTMQDKHFRPIINALHGSPGGEPRMAYLYLREGHKQAVIEAVERRYAKKLTWIDPAEALQAGLFGPEAPYAEVPHRLGDLILTPRLTWRLHDERTPPLIGWHGGLSDWEMLIPLLWKRL